jgi:hypothetical protein
MSDWHMSKQEVRNDMAYTRRAMRLVDAYMKSGDWNKVEEIAQELSGVWGNIQQAALVRQEES